MLYCSRSFKANGDPERGEVVGKGLGSGSDGSLLKLTREERREMLLLEERGELPTEIDRSTDLFFRFLLGRPSRTHLLLDLVNAIFETLGHPRVRRLELAETELAPEGWRRKHARLDLRAVDEHGRHLNIELQREGHEHFVPRCLYYWGKSYVRQLGAGRSYHDLRATVLISLLGFPLFPEERPGVWDFVLTNPVTRKVLTWDELLVYVELKKFRDGIDRIRERMKADPTHKLTDEERLAVWSGYMSNDGTGVSLMRTALSGDKVFEEVTAAEREYWGTPEYRYYQLRAQMDELDRRAIEETRIKKAEQRGMEQGMAQGMAQAKRETVRNLLRMGVDVRTAAEATGLPIEEIEGLR